MEHHEGCMRPSDSMTHSIISLGKDWSRLSARSVLQKAVPFEVATGNPHPLTRAKSCALCTLAPGKLP